jgi:hypothetical protein
MVNRVRPIVKGNPMKKLLVKMIPGFFTIALTCCGGTLEDALNQSDYTKYKAEQARKLDLSAGRIQ